MVTIPKTAAVPATANVSTARAGPGTRVASAYTGVDELQQNIGVSFDVPSYVFDEDNHPTFRRGEDRNTGRQHPGLVASSSQAFAAMLEGNEIGSGAGKNAGGSDDSAFSGLISKAISVYENNARVISGDNFVLGRSLSLEL